VSRYLALLRNGPFATLWAGSTVSAFGDSLTWVALVWLAFERGGASAVSVLVVAATAPVLVGGVVMGLALDRFDRVPVLVAVNLILAGAVAVVPLWSMLAGPPPAVLLLAVAALYGFLKIANWAGVPALIPALVPRHALNTANAMESMSFGIADVAGPAIAGALIAVVSAELVLGLDALTYVAFLGCLLALRPRLPRSRPDAGADGVGLRPALRFLRGSPPILATTLMFMAFNVGEGMLLVLMPAYTSSVLGAGAGTYGLLLSSFSLAVLAGSVAVGAVEWRHGLGRSIAGTQALAGSAFILLALVNGRAATVAVLLLAGLLVSPLTIWAQTLRMRLIPEQLRGRAFGLLRTLMQATPPIGGAAAGLLLAGPGLTTAIVAMSAVMALPGIAGLLSPALAGPVAGTDPSAPLLPPPSPPTLP
jgi:MFS family permease